LPSSIFLIGGHFFLTKTKETEAEQLNPKKAAAGSISKIGLNILENFVFF